VSGLKAVPAAAATSVPGRGQATGQVHVQVVVLPLINNNALFDGLVLNSQDSGCFVLGFKFWLLGSLGL
jgi:hypothetical protein